MSEKRNRGFDRSVNILVLVTSLVIFGIGAYLSDSVISQWLIGISGNLFIISGLFFIIQEWLAYHPERNSIDTIENKLETIQLEISTLKAAQENNQLKVVQGEDKIYPAFIKARNEINAQELRSTALGGRKSMTKGIKWWLEENHKWLKEGAVLVHEKVFRVGDTNDIQSLREYLELSKDLVGNSVRYIEPIRLSGLDIVILDAKEAWIAFPPVAGHDEVSFAISTRDPLIVSNLRMWYETHLWNASTEVTSETLAALEKKINGSIRFFNGENEIYDEGIRLILSAKSRIRATALNPRYHAAPVKLVEAYIEQAQSRLASGRPFRIDYVLGSNRDFVVQRDNKERIEQRHQAFKAAGLLDHIDFYTARIEVGFEILIIDNSHLIIATPDAGKESMFNHGIRVTDNAEFIQAYCEWFDDSLIRANGRKFDSPDQLTYTS